MTKNGKEVLALEVANQLCIDTENFWKLFRNHPAIRTLESCNILGEHEADEIAVKAMCKSLDQLK
jgi:hypothetical protein